MIRRRLGDDAGSVVAELAVALPAFVLVVLLGVGSLTAAARHVRLQDAAADAARLASRGESEGRVVSAVTAAVGGASARIERRDDLVCVTAAAPAGPPLPALTIAATGCALDGGG